MKSASRFFKFGALLCVLVGCSVPTTSERTATLAANGVWPTTLPTIDQRACVVFSGHGVQIDFKLSHVVGDTATARVGFVPERPKNAHTAMVTAIDRRGYFITAAHVVTGDPIFVFLPKQLGRPARVVFRGDDNFDVAILAVDRPIHDVFDWAEDGTFDGGKLLLECGPTGPAEGLGVQVFAGKAVEIDGDRSDECQYELVGTTLPMRPGDSGGPVMTGDGSLVGVAVHYNPITRESFALRPSRAWVKDVIDRDYKITHTVATWSEIFR